MTKGDARETIIRIDHDEKRAYVWTTNKRILSRLAKVGATKEGTDARQGFYTLLPRQISLRKVAKSRGFSGNLRQSKRGSDAK